MESIEDKLRTDVLWHRRRGNETIAQDCERAANEIGKLRAALVEARRWIGDGDLSDGLSKEYWTAEYAAAVSMVDAALAGKRQP